MIKDAAKNPFVEVYVKCPIEECSRRDPKGLYAKQKSGIISGLTGIDAPYEEPQEPDVIVKTHEYSIDECVSQIIKAMKD